MRIVFMGTPESAVPSLRGLVDDGHEIVSVWTQPDKPAGRGKKLHQSPVKEFALERNLTLHQPQRIRTREAKELFASHKADLAIVVAYGKILPTEFLAAPRQGCVNVHFSLLPKYRGAAPVNWAIVNGEQQTGVTTMRIVEELDAGPILLQKATKIGERETAPELLSRLSETGAELISETLRNLNDIEPKPQLDSESTLAPILKREDGLVDWSMDAFAIERRVRGFQPWPTAHTTLSSRRLIVWRATAERDEARAGAPGEIIAAHGADLAVAAGGSTLLRILELQPEGGRRITSRDFLNGSHVKVGTRFGTQSVSENWRGREAP
ncbi:MAG TPA: methionyl-tRNA formyltransferase [Pyrinomonadaceae bacterium]|nr:methionyl-tRNA formyltransferase [Pyrinomonadaceae bacterium]